MGSSRSPRVPWFLSYLGLLDSPYEADSTSQKGCTDTAHHMLFSHWTLSPTLPLRRGAYVSSIWICVGCRLQT